MYATARVLPIDQRTLAHSPSLISKILPTQTHEALLAVYPSLLSVARTWTDASTSLDARHSPCQYEWVFADVSWCDSDCFQRNDDPSLMTAQLLAGVIRHHSTSRALCWSAVSCQTYRCWDISRRQKCVQDGKHAYGVMTRTFVNVEAMIELDVRMGEMISR